MNRGNRSWGFTRRLAWLAWLALFALAAVPTLSRAVAAADPAAGAWAVCSADPARSLQDGAALLPSLDHCPLCSLAQQAVSFGSGSTGAHFLPADSPWEPGADRTAPRPDLSGWRVQRPRGPPR